MSKQPYFMIAGRTYLFILFSCFTIVTAYSQVSIKALKLSHIDTNQLYIGVDNPLKVEGVAQSQVEISCKFCGIKRTDKNEFTARPYHIGTDTLTVSQNGKPIFVKAFEVRRISDPKICVAKYHTTDAAIEEILADPALYFIIPNCLFVHNITVLNFSCVFMKQNGDIITTFSSQTNRFTDEQVKIISSLKKGDKIFFDKGTLGGPGSMPGTFASFTLTIK